MKGAVYNALDDGTITGKILACEGIFALGKTEVECQQRLQSTLESWILLGLKFKHPLPVIHGINLNQEPRYEK